MNTVSAGHDCRLILTFWDVRTYVRTYVRTVIIVITTGRPGLWSASIVGQ